MLLTSAHQLKPLWQLGVLLLLAACRHLPYCAAALTAHGKGRLLQQLYCRYYRCTALLLCCRCGLLPVLSTSTLVILTVLLHKQLQQLGLLACDTHRMVNACLLLCWARMSMN